MSSGPGIGIAPERLLSLFRRMVDIYSPSGKEEELADMLCEALARTGLDVRRLPVDESRFNLLISSGRAQPDLLFLGHIDTVPAFDIEEYGAVVKNGTLSGLGAADMKSGCAAMIEAFVAAAEADRLPDDVALALVVGEEETGDGTAALLRTHRFREALVAEPTDLQPCLQHYGYVEMLVRAFGYRQHAAVSGRDTNAVRAMLRLLLALEDRIERDDPETVLNIRDLHSSESGFAVPDRCAASVDLHIPPDREAQPYAEAMAAFVERELNRSGASRYEIDFPTLANGYRVDPDAPLTRHLRQILEARDQRWMPASFQSHSDANLLRDTGCRPIILGPGQLAKAHTRDESVETAQVIAAAEIYAGLLIGLHGEAIGAESMHFGEPRRGGTE